MQDGIRGWREAQDLSRFVFAVRIKGVHLDNLEGTPTSERCFLSCPAASRGTTTPAGELELVVDNGQTVQCALILMSEWRTKLPDLLRRGGGRCDRRRSLAFPYTLSANVR